MNKILIYLAYPPKKNADAVSIGVFCERDRSGTTRQSAPLVRVARDGADSPTRVREAHEAARPKEFCFAKFNEE